MRRRNYASQNGWFGRQRQRRSLSRVRRQGRPRETWVDGAARQDRVPIAGVGIGRSRIRLQGRRRITDKAHFDGPGRLMVEAVLGLDAGCDYGVDELTRDLEVVDNA